ncbi:hypothetical protein ABN150_13020 [Klebsiella oxytoca]|uniref:hypothetical protein n=1 Tax=Klebsiella oxytoca TaxID=571 RepID=UPI0032DA7899
MSAMEKWDDDAFIQAMTEVILDKDISEEPVNLSAERQDQVISWTEFAGDFT